MRKKKLIIILSLVAVVALGILAISRADIGLKNPWLDGEAEDVTRGDLIIPVTATGTIEAANLVQIKSKASGEVVAIEVVEGQMVEAGDVLVRLDPVDEKRNVEARQADLDRARAAAEKAKINQENQRRDLPLMTKLAQARYDDAGARFNEAKFQWERIQRLQEDHHTSEVEVVRWETAYLTAKAARDVAETESLRAQNNEQLLIKTAEEDVKQFDAAYRAAQKAFDEAQLRLDETTVHAPSAGMVYSIRVRVGEMIQSGTVSLTGGTALLILADTRAMFVMAQVDEADIGAIRTIAPAYARPGQTEKLEETAYRDNAARIIKSMLEGEAPEALDDVSLQLLGRPVEIAVEAFPGRTYYGVIERILPEPQRLNNVISFNVRVRLVGDGVDTLMHGLQADLSFTTEKKKDVVLIKNEALHSEGRKCFVYVPVTGKPRDEEKVPVEIGTTDGTYTEITSGLEKGERVWVKRPRKTEKEKEASERDRR